MQSIEIIQPIAATASLLAAVIGLAYLKVRLKRLAAKPRK